MSRVIARVELNESSGPVSPRYQYTLRVLVERTAHGAAITWERTGKEAGRAEATLSTEEARALFDELGTLGAETIGGDHIGEKRKNKGVSFNAVDIAFDDGSKSRCDYLLSQIDDDGDDAFAPRAFIERLHALARATR
jgi:hypothetical protein